MKEKHKAALVTGSVKRLGRDIALKLAELRFNLVLSYFNSTEEEARCVKDEIESYGVEALCVKADLRKTTDIRMLFSETEKKFGRLDILVNNAAIFGRKDFMDITTEDFDEFMNMNVKNAFFCSQEAAKIMLQSKEENCSIINITSLGAIQNWQTAIPYSIAKAGLLKLTKILAKRLAPKILVNSIAPGTIWVEDDDNLTAATEDASTYPMKRFGNTEDINSVIEYLVIKNKWTTGNNFVVDGGKSL